MSVKQFRKIFLNILKIFFKITAAYQVKDKNTFVFNTYYRYIQSIQNSTWNCVCTMPLNQGRAHILTSLSFSESAFNSFAVALPEGTLATLVQ